MQPRAHASVQALTCTREENDTEIYLARTGVGQITVRPGLRTTSSVSPASGASLCPFPQISLDTKTFTFALSLVCFFSFFFPGMNARLNPRDPRNLTNETFSLCKYQKKSYCRNIKKFCVCERINMMTSA